MEGKSMVNNSIVTIAAFCVYLVFMLCIGMYFVGKNKTTSEYFLGGRQLGSWVTGLSAQASDISAGWIAIGLAIGTYLNWLLVAKPLRQYTKIADDAITLPQFFKNRFHDESGWISVISALFILVFFLFYTASGFVSCAKLFSSVFGIPYMVSLVIGAVVVISYTFAGGFFAVCWTDFFQGMLMFFCVVAVPCIAVSQMGGPSDFISSVEVFNPNFLSMMVDGATNQPYTALGIVSLIAWGLGYFGMPHILLRFMAIREEKKLNQSRRIATIWVVISMFIAVFIGVIGNSVTAAGKVPALATSAESETIIIKLADLMSRYGVVLAVMAGVILSGILAATMSTADSQLLAAASSVSQDLMQHSFGVKMSQRTTMLAARATVICIALVGIVLAWDPNSSVFRVVSFAWAGFGAAFGPVMLFSLFWKRANRQGALAGMITGGVVVFIWKYLIAPMGGAWAIYELLPAFLAACAAIVIVSLATKAPEKAVTDLFDEVRGK